jgi:hypothetical protein
MAKDIYREGAKARRRMEPQITETAQMEKKCTPLSAFVCDICAICGFSVSASFASSRLRAFAVMSVQFTWR